jgi:antitoxin CptB
MDETSTPLESRRRRLLFRANHRGTRENDLLIGGFVAARLSSFSEAEIGVLESIIQLPDTWLADWLTGRAPIPAEYDWPLLRAMRDAHGQSPL